MRKGLIIREEVGLCQKLIKGIEDLIDDAKYDPKYRVQNFDSSVVAKGNKRNSVKKNNLSSWLQSETSL